MTDISPRIIYGITAVTILIVLIIFHLRYNLLNDASKATKKPFSYARVQLAWWTFIVLSIFISIIIAGGRIPILDSSTLVLIGLGVLTTGAARIIDISDQQQQTSQLTQNTAATPLSVDENGQGFLLDILSDKNGVSIHRLQAVTFNFVFGAWFIYQSFINVQKVYTKLPLTDLNHIIPILDSSNLVLLGLSAGTYAALKSTENK